MKREGMVHALRRACRWLTPQGFIIDIHPTAEPARVAISTGTGVVYAGELEDNTQGYGPQGRHAQADAAVATALAEGWLVREAGCDVTFWHEADSLPEMVAHVSLEWRDGHLGPSTLERASALVGAHPHARLLLREELTMARLRPLDDTNRFIRAIYPPGRAGQTTP